MRSRLPSVQARDHHAFRLHQRLGVLDGCGKNVDALLRALRREVSPRVAAGADDIARLGDGLRVERPLGEFPCELGPLLGGEVEALRRQRLIDRCAEIAVDDGAGLEARVVVVGDLRVALDARGVGEVIDDEERIGDVIEDGREFVVKERQPMLEPGMLAPGAHRLVERIVVGDGAEAAR